MSTARQPHSTSQHMDPEAFRSGAAPAITTSGSSSSLRTGVNARSPDDAPQHPAAFDETPADAMADASASRTSSAACASPDHLDDASPSADRRLPAAAAAAAAASADTDAASVSSLKSAADDDDSPLAHPLPPHVVPGPISLAPASWSERPMSLIIGSLGSNVGTTLHPAQIDDVAALVTANALDLGDPAMVEELAASAPGGSSAFERTQEQHAAFPAIFRQPIVGAWTTEEPDSSGGTDAGAMSLSVAATPGVSVAAMSVSQSIGNSVVASPAPGGFLGGWSNVAGSVSSHVDVQPPLAIEPSAAAAAGGAGPSPARGRTAFATAADAADAAGTSTSSDFVAYLANARAGPSPRFGHVACVLPGSRVLIHGGRDGDSYLDDLWVFECATGKWTQIRPPSPDDPWPAGRSGHVACLLANATTLVVYGGATSHQDTTTELWELDTRCFTWRLIDSGPPILPRPSNERGASRPLTSMRPSPPQTPPTPFASDLTSTPASTTTSSGDAAAVEPPTSGDTIASTETSPQPLSMAPPLGAPAAALTGLGEAAAATSEQDLDPATELPPPPPLGSAPALSALNTIAHNPAVAAVHNPGEPIPQITYSAESATDAALLRPMNRKGHTAVCIGDTVYMYGGATQDCVPDPNVWSWNTRCRRWTVCAAANPAPASRRYHNAEVTSDGQMLIFGGQVVREVTGGPATTISSGGDCLNDVHLFDPYTRVWRRVRTAGNAPAPRMCATSVIRGDVLAVFDGADLRHVLSDSHYQLDLVSRRWSRISEGAIPKPIGTNRGTTVAVGNSLLMFGGHTGTSFTRDLVQVRLAPPTLRGVAARWLLRHHPAMLRQLPMPGGEQADDRDLLRTADRRAARAHRTSLAT